MIIIFIKTSFYLFQYWFSFQTLLLPGCHVTSIQIAFLRNKLLNNTPASLNNTFTTAGIITV